MKMHHGESDIEGRIGIVDRQSPLNHLGIFSVKSYVKDHEQHGHTQNRGHQVTNIKDTSTFSNPILVPFSIFIQYHK